MGSPNDSWPPRGTPWSPRGVWTFTNSRVVRSGGGPVSTVFGLVLALLITALALLLLLPILLIAGLLGAGMALFASVKRGLTGAQTAGPLDGRRNVKVVRRDAPNTGRAGDQGPA